MTRPCLRPGTSRILAATGGRRHALWRHVEGNLGRAMTTSRLEAFSDAVIAILITIMVLELKIPHGVHLRALRPVLPVFLTYVLSFVYLGIYWNNHHHL